MEGSRADAIKYLLVYKEMRTNSVFCGSLSKLHDMCGLFRFQQPHLSLREKKLCYKCGDFTVVPVQLTGSRFYYYLLDFKMSGIHSTISQCKLKGKNKSCTRPVVQICTKKWMGSSLLGHTTHFHQSYMNQVSRGLFFFGNSADKQTNTPDWKHTLIGRGKNNLSPNDKMSIWR